VKGQKPQTCSLYILGQVSQSAVPAKDLRPIWTVIAAKPPKSALDKLSHPRAKRTDRMVRLNH